MTEFGSSNFRFTERYEAPSLDEVIRFVGLVDSLTIYYNWEKDSCYISRVYDLPDNIDLSNLGVPELDISGDFILKELGIDSDDKGGKGVYVSRKLIPLMSSSKSQQSPGLTPIRSVSILFDNEIQSSLSFSGRSGFLIKDRVRKITRPAGRNMISAYSKLLLMINANEFNRGLLDKFKMPLN